MPFAAAVAVAPRAAAGERHRATLASRLKEDLDRLGLRHRPIHDARRTFISLALGDGASKDVIRWVTHGGALDVIGGYTTMPWPKLCEAVACLRLELRERVVIELPKAASGNGGEGRPVPAGGGDLRGVDWPGAAIRTAVVLQWIRRKEKARSFSSFGLDYQGGVDGT